MKNVILLSLVNLLNYSFLISQVYVSGRIINAPENAHFSITFFNNTIEYFERTSATEILDKNGEFSAHFEWDKPGIATLSIANEYSDIFLSPEDSLFITADYNSFDSTLLYQGRGQENNNYLATQTQYYFNKRAYRQTKDQDPFQYLEYVDSIEKANIHLYNSFDKNLFTEDFNLYMKNYLKYRFVDPRWMFKVDFSKFDENGKPNYKDLPDDYYAFIWDIDLNDQEAYDNTFYSNAIERYIFEVMSRKDYVNDTSPDKNKFPFYVNRYHLIKSSFKGKVLDFQLTKFMNHYASFQHEDEYWEELMIDYKNTCHNQEYIDIIVNQYQRSTSLSYGKNAPNFILEDIKGDTVSLSSLKGKIVFIDFWATWCSPCLSTMYKTEEMSENLKENTEIVILFINLDDTRKRWKSYLKTKSINGFHLFADKEKSNELRNSFNFNGIPHYVIIGKNGEMIDANAQPGYTTERRIEVFSKKVNN